jgi:hypothetical protein
MKLDYRQEDQSKINSNKKSEICENRNIILIEVLINTVHK